jgi:hypothetical protein
MFSDSIIYAASEYAKEKGFWFFHMGHIYEFVGLYEKWDFEDDSLSVLKYNNPDNLQEIVEQEAKVADAKVAMDQQGSLPYGPETQFINFDSDAFWLEDFERDYYILKEGKKHYFYYPVWGVKRWLCDCPEHVEAAEAEPQAEVPLPAP